MLFGLTVLAALMGLRPAQAQIGSERYSSIVVDARSGNILSAANMDEPRFPASLTKMMTIYMLFEALRDRRLTLGQYVPVSYAASLMPPTKLGLQPGSLITVEQALLGLVTKSANDAAAALGELMGGDEERFAQMMTLRARALGMTHTTFRNASGLPDWNQVTTARDMAILARRLLADFPGMYHYFSTPSFVYGGRVIHNHQRMLQTYPGADGFKTGYIEASGYNVVTSAVRGDTRLIGVVMGASTGSERDMHMAFLLDQGFDRTGAPPALVARREPPSPYPAPYAVPFVSLASAQPITRAAPPPPEPPGFRMVREPAPPPRALPRRMREVREVRELREPWPPGLRPMLVRPMLVRPVLVRPMAVPPSRAAVPVRIREREAAPVRRAAPSRTAHAQPGRYRG